MPDSSVSAADHEYNLFLLGPPELRWRTELISVRRRQVRALIYVLGYEQAPLTRERLAFLFWRDRPESTARRNLTRLLSAARTELNDQEFFLVHHDQISLDLQRVWLDCTAFEKWHVASERAALEKAAQHYRGRFLQGFSLPDSPAFGDWQDMEARQLERDYLALLLRLVDVCQESGDIAAAIGYARSYLAVDELAEEVHRRLISLYATDGDRSAAARQFEACAIVLERELGVRPLPETRAAYEAALAEPAVAAPVPVAPVWNVLPSLDLPLTGREEALQALNEAHERLQSGGLILITGEPGVGKTRLMQDFATDLPFLVLAGSNPPGAQNIGYTALIEILRQALGHRRRWQGIRPIWLAEIGRLLPELGELFPNLPPPLAVEPAQAQARLFEALSQCLLGLARHEPLMLCLDDMHWADAETLAWLGGMPRRLSGSGLRVMATCRSGEMSALAEVKRAFARTGLLAEVALQGLTREAVERFLKKLPEHPLDAPRLAERVHHATGGNAFFVLETVRMLLEAGGPGDELGDDAHLARAWSELPLAPTVEAAIRRRLDSLSVLGRQVLETSAVLGSDLRLPYLERTAGRSDLEVAEGLDELVRRQLLADGGERHFSHDLVRQVTYENISPWRRRILHRRAAVALEEAGSRDDEQRWALIARHFDSAGDGAEAIRCYERAARVATRLFAHEEAIHHLRRAIELAGKNGEIAVDSAHLHEALGDSLLVMGLFAEAQTVYGRALEAAADNEPVRLAELERKLAGTLPPQRRSREAKEVYGAALARLEEVPPAQRGEGWQAKKLDILLGLLDALYFRARPHAMAAHIEETQALLDAVGTVEQQVNFYARLNQMAFLQHRFRAPVENTMLARKALALAREAGNPGLVARQQFHLGFHLLWHGEWEEAERLFQRCLEAAEGLGDSWLHNQCLVYLTIVYRLQGDESRVAALVSQLVEVSQRVGYVMYVAVGQAIWAWLHYRAAEWQAARAQAEVALESWAASTYPFQWLAHWLLLDMALRQDRMQDALSAAHAMLNDNQQPPPHDIEAALETAIAAWETGEEDAARAVLERAVEQARRQGYL